MGRDDGHDQSVHSLGTLSQLARQYGRMASDRRNAESEDVRKQAMTEFEEFILAMDEAMKNGARAEQALRAYVIARAEKIRQEAKER